MNRTERLARRREAKFKRHGVKITEEQHSEIRKGVLYEFAHAVRVKGQVEGRTLTRRSALKRAHQITKNHR